MKKIKVKPHWTRRIRLWLDRGLIEDAEWYPRANVWCKRMAHIYGTDYRRVAAVLAALSPGTRWERNKLECEAMLQGGGFGFTTYPRNVEKAKGIWKGKQLGDYYHVVKPLIDSGHKIGSFYWNIAHPDEGRTVTIDRHAIAICIGHPPKNGEASIGTWKYHCYAEAYRIVARECDMRAHEVQAITWAAYRRANGDLHQEQIPF